MVIDQESASSLLTSWTPLERAYNRHRDRIGAETDLTGLCAFDSS